MANRLLNKNIVSSTQYNGTSSIGAVAGTWGGATWASMTWMAWVRLDSISSDYIAVVSSTAGDFFHMQSYPTSAGKIAIYVNTGTILIDSPTQALLVKKWHHIAVSTKSGATNVYFDGTLFSTATTAYTNITQATSFKMGAGFGSGRKMIGNITDVVVCKAADGTAALSAAEIKAAYLSGNYSSLTGLYGYWPHTDGQGTTITDTVTGNNVTLTSTTWNLDTPSKQRRAIRPLAASLAFDGSTTYVSIPNGTILNHTTNVTVGGWVWNAGRGSINVFYSKFRAGLNGWVFYVTGGQLYVTKALVADFPTGTYLQPNALYHIAAKLGASSQITVYVNGVKVYVSSNAGAIGANSDAATLGVSRDAAGAFQYFSNMNMSDWVFIDAAASDAEVLAWYQNNTIPAGAAGRWLLNEGSGTTATDSVGTIGNGTITGGVWSQDVPMGLTRKVTGISLPNSVTFTTGTNYVDLTASTWDTSGAWSISFWVKATSLATIGGIIGKDVSGNGTNAFIFYQSYNTLNAQMRGTSGNTDVNMGRIDLNKWVHVVATIDASKHMVAYLNGSIKIQATLPSQPANVGTFRVGRGIDAFWGTFAGSVRSVHTYNKMLSHDEVIKDYNQQTVTGLVNSWAMNEGTGTNVVDSVAAQNGTLTNSPTWTTDGPIY